MRPTILLLLLTTLTAQTRPALAQTEYETLAFRLLNSQGCKACHRIGESGGSVAPSLEGVGSRLTREQLRSSLVNPQRRHAGGRISDFSHLQPHELEALITLLSNRK